MQKQRYETMPALIQFTVSNFRSFLHEKTFNMVPSSIKDEPRDNVFVKGHNRFLRTAAVYGANSSGKSNLILAMNVMKLVVANSVKLNDNDKLLYDPFLLSDTSANTPTHFEVVFLNQGVRYRYGFEYLEKTIVGEWLFVKKTAKEQVLFIRNEEGIGVDEASFGEGKGLEERTNGNRLFLSLTAQLGGSVSKSVLSFFLEDFNVISGNDAVHYKDVSLNMLLQHGADSEKALRFLNQLQLGFRSLEAKEILGERESLLEDFSEKYNGQDLQAVAKRRQYKILTTHGVYSKKGEPTGEKKFNLFEKESLGTQKIFELAGSLFDSLQKGKVLVVDELDTKMHPLISLYILRLFNGKETNPMGAQLIFATHDTHLLSSSVLRRDQIWFTEKDEQEVTDLYNLMDIVLPDGTKPRSDSNLEKNYISGRYGAIPYILND